MPRLSGYDEYLGKPCWYSFDVGERHFALSSPPMRLIPCSFLPRPRPRDHDQEVRSCFWDHPCFSLGSMYGNQARVEPFWSLLSARMCILRRLATSISSSDSLRSHRRRFGPGRGIRQFTVGWAERRPRDNHPQPNGGPLERWPRGSEAHSSRRLIRVALPVGGWENIHRFRLRNSPLIRQLNA